MAYNDLWKEQSRYNIRSIYYLQQRTNVTQHVPHRFLFKSFITQFTKHCSFARRKISLINGLHLELVLNVCGISYCPGETEHEGNLETERNTRSFVKISSRMPTLHTLVSRICFIKRFTTVFSLYFIEISET